MKAFVPILILTWVETIGHNVDKILLRTGCHFGAVFFSGPKFWSRRLENTVGDNVNKT
jgi:hypothetical protein